MNDPTQFEQVDETCEFGGAVLYSESLGITAFFENAVPSKYETQKLKQLQFGIENEKIRQFEHECLIRLFQWSFLPPGKALDFSVCDEAFGCYKTQYRKRYLLEICQNASFLSTPAKKEHHPLGWCSFLAQVCCANLPCVALIGRRGQCQMYVHHPYAGDPKTKLLRDCSARLALL